MTAADIRVDGRALRDVLGRFATGVTVLTTVYRGSATGLTVNSFTSVSLEPPLVLWCLRRSSACRPAFASASHFAVNILAAQQQELAARFAGPGDRFSHLPVRVGPFGLPLFDHAIGMLICRRDRIMPAGDHIVLLGRVLNCWARAGAPLMFLDGAYHSV
jgi:flavin reductase (DIM6/NTAB) family NADH-FMN oxidoreductase RutF